MLEARTEPPLHLRVTDTTLQGTDTTVSIPPPVLPCVAAPPGRLSVVFPRALAAAYGVAEGPFVLGRQGDARLLHPTVSRAHAAIAWSPEAGAHLVRDLDSHNGSVLDGVPLGRRPRPLRDGSVLRLGGVLAVWEHLPAIDDPDGPEPAAARAVDRDAIPGQAARVQALRAAIARAACDRAMETLLLQRWPLNLRAVERLVRDLATRPPDLPVNPCDLPAWLQSAAPGAIADPLFAGARDTTLDASRRDAQLDLPPRSRPPVPSRDQFIAAFEQLGGSVRALARHFARDRRQIYRWIEAHGIADRR